MPPESKRTEQDQTYGRQITESQPEKVIAEAGQGHQREREEKAGLGRQTSSQQRALIVNIRCRFSVSNNPFQEPSRPKG